MDDEGKEPYWSVWKRRCDFLLDVREIQLNKPQLVKSKEEELEGLKALRRMWGLSDPTL